MVSHQGGHPSGWSLIRVVCHEGGLSLGWYHPGGLSSGWYQVVTHQGVHSSGWSLIRVVCHQDSFIRWPLSRVVSDGLLLGWSVVFDQGGLSVVSLWDGLSSGWSIIRVGFDEELLCSGGPSVQWNPVTKVKPSNFVAAQSRLEVTSQRRSRFQLQLLRSGGCSIRRLTTSEVRHLQQSNFTHLLTQCWDIPFEDLDKMHALMDYCNKVG